ncbi:hypothetical protein DICSQDRAFT_128132 [Dichomitus squalens LYAD-421 SS1]|uniref:Uncharacterized protein n=1 Tax=Dichomitus squalens (strain LYAD-421) TaxID=732165 RepID=R7SUM8_DICSQ|nr:uncharacterized protein DICSQDRAFT_128132 [Dichomitus squalens LYAD-421 SS1]EJF59618.1 hypothetical protein DICSQDRAFT_128132 [Dichomitus squalens LYAD-421 SS1]
MTSVSTITQGRTCHLTQISSSSCVKGLGDGSCRLRDAFLRFSPGRSYYLMVTHFFSPVKGVWSLDSIAAVSVRLMNFRQGVECLKCPQERYYSGLANDYCGNRTLGKMLAIVGEIVLSIGATHLSFLVATEAQDLSALRVNVLRFISRETKFSMTRVTHAEAHYRYAWTTTLGGSPLLRSPYHSPISQSSWNRSHMQRSGVLHRSGNVRRCYIPFPEPHIQHVGYALLNSRQFNRGIVVVDDVSGPNIFHLAHRRAVAETWNVPQVEDRALNTIQIGVSTEMEGRKWDFKTSSLSRSGTDQELDQEFEFESTSDGKSSRGSTATNSSFPNAGFPDGSGSGIRREANTSSNSIASNARQQRPGGLLAGIAEPLQAAVLAGYGVDEPLGRCATRTAHELIAAQDKKVADCLNALYNEMRAGSTRVDFLRQKMEALARGASDRDRQVSQGVNAQGNEQNNVSESSFKKKMEEFEQHVNKETRNLQILFGSYVDTESRRFDTFVRQTMKDIKKDMERRIEHGLNRLGEDILKRTAATQAHADRRVASRIDIVEGRWEYLERRIGNLEQWKNADKGQALEEAMRGMMEKVVQLEDRFVGEISGLGRATNGLEGRLKKCEEQIALLEDAQIAQSRAVHDDDKSDSEASTKPEKTQPEETPGTGVNQTTEVTISYEERLRAVEERTNSRIDNLDSELGLCVDRLQRRIVTLERLVARVENGARNGLSIPFVQVPALDAWSSWHMLLHGTGTNTSRTA